MNFKYIATVLLCLFLVTGGIAALRLERQWLSITPARAAYQPKSDSKASLQFFGDVMLDRNVARNMGKSGLAYIFAQTPTSSLFNAELVVANLEGPFAKRRVPTGKSIAFRFDPTLASQLKSYSFSAFNLANNHSYDMGSTNVSFTRSQLQQAGLSYFGDELREGMPYSWFVTTTDGTRVAFLGLHNTYHQLDLVKVAKALTDARGKANLVIANVHWGVEYRPTSTKKQQTLAHWLIDHGVDAVIGHHPHVVEEAEVYKGKPIFYSLGNFIFDQYFSTTTQEGLSVKFDFQNNKIFSATLIPFYGVKSQIYLMDGERRDEFLETLKKRSRLGESIFSDGVLSLEMSNSQ